MTRPILTGALAALVFPCLLHGATSVDEHRPASPQGSVEVDNVAGSIDIQGWDKAEVAVTGSIGKDVERVEVTGDANRTSIRVILPHGHNWGVHDGDAHLVIRVPSHSSLAASLVSSDLTLAAVHGNLELRTVSGNIRGEGGGDVHVNTVSGDIHLKGSMAKVVELKSISGEIHFVGGNGDIEASSVSSDVELSLGTMSRTRFKTISGKLFASLTAAPDAQIDGESVGGDIQLDLASAPSADYDIQTLSGDIDNCFGPKPVRSRYGPGTRLNFKTGEGGARVRISSGSGAVKLCTK